MAPPEPLCPGFSKIQEPIQEADVISDRYNFNEFVDVVIDNTPEQVRILAIEESDEVRHRRKSHRNVRGMEDSGRRYDQLLSALAYFVRHGGKPVDLDEWETNAFRRLCEAWVHRGQRQPSNPQYRNRQIRDTLLRRAARYSF